MAAKTILVTGATDGIGLLTAQMLAADGHHVLIHGRNPEKLARAAEEIGGNTESYVADFASIGDVDAMAGAILEAHPTLDVLINNAGILKAAAPVTPDGLDVRFVVNTLAPYALAERLLPIMPKSGRVVNLSSAAQAPVDPDAMAGKATLDDMGAYAQSKLAITIWTAELARAHPDGPVFVAVNPGSLLASKMVKEGFGIAGKDLSIGAKILCRAALDAEFADATGRYFDNDSGEFGPPHPAAEDGTMRAAVMAGIADLLARLRG